MSFLLNGGSARLHIKRFFGLWIFSFKRLDSIKSLNRLLIELVENLYLFSTRLDVTDGAIQKTRRIARFSRFFWAQSRFSAQIYATTRLRQRYVLAVAR
jgi:hypothetical protein